MDKFGLNWFIKKKLNIDSLKNNNNNLFRINILIS